MNVSDKFPIDSYVILNGNASEFESLMGKRGKVVGYVTDIDVVIVAFGKRKIWVDESKISLVY